MRIKRYLILILVSLLVVGIWASEVEKSKDTIAISEMNALTNDLARKIEESPTAEGIRAARQIIDDRKNSIKVTFESLKTSGRFRKKIETEECSETNECSETAKEFERYRNINIDKIASLYDKYQDAFYDDLKNLNAKKQQLILNPSPKAIKEINKITTTLEGKISFLTELDNLVSSYKSIFD